MTRAGELSLVVGDKLEGRKHHVEQRESSTSALSWLLFRSLRAPSEEQTLVAKLPSQVKAACRRSITVQGSLVFMEGILVVMVLAQAPVILECSDKG